MGIGLSDRLKKEFSKQFPEESLDFHEGRVRPSIQCENPNISFARDLSRMQFKEGIDALVGSTVFAMISAVPLLHFYQNIHDLSEPSMQGILLAVEGSVGALGGLIACNGLISATRNIYKATRNFVYSKTA